MSTVLIVYGTGEGHTDDVVATMAEQLRSHTVDVTVAHVDKAPSTPDGYDAVVVGSSIHVGKHDKHVVAWIESNLSWLSDHPSAFFQVSMSSATGSPEGDAQAGTYVHELSERTGWHPDLVGLFGGALLYTRYGFAKRAVLKSIAQKTGLDTDTKHDHDYTDYDAVRRFADDVGALVS